MSGGSTSAAASSCVGLGKLLVFAIPLLFALVIVSTVVSGLWSAASEQYAVPAPRELAGYRLGQTMSGQEAMAEISGLHGKDLEVADAWVAHYQGSGAVWVARATGPDGAARMIEAMIRGIERGSSPFKGLEQKQLNGVAFDGGCVVHIGVIIMVIGIAGSMFFSTNLQEQLAPGESVEIRGYTLTFQGLQETATEHTSKMTGTLAVSRNGKNLGTVSSSKRIEGHSRDDAQPITDVGIRSKPLEDLYVILASWTEDRQLVTFKVLVNPLMMWVWVGSGVLVAGTIIAFWPDRRETLQVPVRRPAHMPGAEASRA